MTTANTATRTCACGCGEEVKGSRAPAGAPAWKRGHKARGENGHLTVLPGPEDDLDGEDLDGGDIFPDGDSPDDDADADLPDWLTEPAIGGAPAAEPPPAPPRDKPPGRLAEPRGPRGPQGGTKLRVTATVRKDVQAKIRMVLVPVGLTWELRDPPCGSSFRVQEPDISEALAEIVCDSPDLLAWFTGPAGGFMKYFKLLMACQPVAVMIWMHHIQHVQFEMAGPDQPAGQPAEAFAA